MKRVLVVAVAIAMMVASWPVSAAGPGAVSRPAGQATGAIRGTAMSSTGQALAYVTVPVRNLYTGQLAGSTTSNAAGSFNIAGLNPGSYIVEVVNPGGTIVGSSAVVTVSSGATATVTVTTTAPAAFAAQGTTAQGSKVRTAVIITAIATGAGIAAAIAIANNDSSPSR